MFVNWYYVYVLFSLKDKKLYIGFSRNIKRRLVFHNQGLNKSTKFRRPLVLIHAEAFISEKDARQRELFFKKGRGREVLKDYLKDTLSKVKEDSSVGRPAAEAGS